ncbi:hypothetical protein XFF6990_280033 [Xanthomonas citri pv. fuscans]|nr:hypothetical protein XFF6990_280033 [Xanthomonas citri pv. fuscans]
MSTSTTSSTKWATTTRNASTGTASTTPRCSTRSAAKWRRNMCLRFERARRLRTPRWRPWRAGVWCLHCFRQGRRTWRDDQLDQRVIDCLHRADWRQRHRHPLDWRPPREPVPTSPLRPHAFQRGGVPEPVEGRLLPPVPGPLPMKQWQRAKVRGINASHERTPQPVLLLVLRFSDAAGGGRIALTLNTSAAFPKSRQRTPGGFFVAAAPGSLMQHRPPRHCYAARHR